MPAPSPGPPVPVAGPTSRAGMAGDARTWTLGESVPPPSLLPRVGPEGPSRHASPARFATAWCLDSTLLLPGAGLSVSVGPDPRGSVGRESQEVGSFAWGANRLSALWDPCRRTCPFPAAFAGDGAWCPSASELLLDLPGPCVPAPRRARALGRPEVMPTPRGTAEPWSSLGVSAGQAPSCHPSSLLPPPLLLPRAPRPPRAGDPGGEGPEHEPALDPALRWEQHHHGLRHRIQEQVR